MIRREFLGGFLALLAASGCGGGDNSPSSPAAQQQSQPALDAALDRVFATTRSTSVRALVLAENRFAWTGQRGLDTTVDPFTRIGSVTKTVTGTCVLQLVDEGLVGLDQTVERWFPQLSESRELTIRMLGTMASGIASYSTDDTTMNRYLSDPYLVWTPQQLMDISFALPRSFRPGQGYQYSNTNFLMLAHIVEQVSGLPIDRYMQERIFARVGMTSTTYPYTPALPADAWRGRTEQGSPRDSTDWNPTFLGAAGELVSNLQDLLRWSRALGQGTLLSAATQAQRLLPNPHSEGGGRAYLFGLGNDRGWLAHSGEIPGYNTQIAYDPRGDVSIVVLCNSDIPTSESLLPAAAIYAGLRAAWEAG